MFIRSIILQKQWIDSISDTFVDTWIDDLLNFEDALNTLRRSCEDLRWPSWEIFLHREVLKDAFTYENEWTNDSEISITRIRLIRMTNRTQCSA